MKEDNFTQQQAHLSLSLLSTDIMSVRSRTYSASSSKSSSTSSSTSSPPEMPASPVFYSLKDEPKDFSDFVDLVAVEQRLIDVANRAKARRRSTGMVSLEKSLRDFHNSSSFSRKSPCSGQSSARRNRGNSAPTSGDLSETQLVDGILTTNLCSTEL